jgi:hypothetical protein
LYTAAENSGLATGDDTTQPSLVSGALRFGNHEVPNLATEGVRSREAEDSLGGGVDLYDRPSLVDRDHSIRGGIVPFTPARSPPGR